MFSTVGDVLDESRVLLNDQAAKLYTNTIMLPVFKKAYRELRQQFVDNGISTTRELSASETVPANTTLIDFTTTPSLPINLLYPIELEEKLQGQTDNDFIKMTETVWPTDITPDGRLNFWDWRQNALHFPGATGITILRIKYWGELTAVEDEGSEVLVLDSETFLAARCASIAATTIGGAPSKGEILQQDANSALATLISTAVKNRQALPTRRRRFKSFGRRSWVR